MMPRLCSPWRDRGRITLPCVAGDSWAPRVHGLVALHGREAVAVVANLRLFGVVVFSLFSGPFFLVSHLPILGSGLLFPGNNDRLEVFWWSEGPVVTFFVHIVNPT